MVKLIWLSDLHFVSSGEEVLGHDPTVRLTTAIEDINAHHGDALTCVISGDLVNRGATAEYRELKSHLERLEIPWIPMVGNHDDRALLKAELTPVGIANDHDFVQYALKTDVGHILCLDTLKAGRDAGTYCAERYAWLDARLTDASAAPVYIFMHHPPAKLGLPMQDQDCLENGDDFLAFLKQRATVRHLFSGHVHRPVCGTLDDIPFTTMRSCLYQAPPPLPVWDWDTFRPAAEAPNYGVIELTGRDVRVHYHQFAHHDQGARFR